MVNLTDKQIQEGLQAILDEFNRCRSCGVYDTYQWDRPWGSYRRYEPTALDIWILSEVVKRFELMKGD